MSEVLEVINKPEIVVSDVDHWRLSNLATAARNQFPDVAEELQAEMVRADIAEPGTMPADVVTMGSAVEFRKGAEERRSWLDKPAVTQSLVRSRRLGPVRHVRLREPHQGPFPEIADNVVQALDIRREAIYGRGAHVADLMEI